MAYWQYTTVRVAPFQLKLHVYIPRSNWTIAALCCIKNSRVLFRGLERNKTFPFKLPHSERLKVLEILTFVSETSQYCRHKFWVKKPCYFGIGFIIFSFILSLVYYNSLLYWVVIKSVDTLKLQPTVQFFVSKCSVIWTVGAREVEFYLKYGIRKPQLCTIYSPVV